MTPRWPGGLPVAAALAASLLPSPSPSVGAGTMQELLKLEGDVGGTHDPVVIKQVRRRT